MERRASLAAAAFTSIALCSSTLSGFSQTQQRPAQKPVASPVTPAAAQNPPPGASQWSSDQALLVLDEKTRRGLALQVALDRAGFSPGEIDGAPGSNTDRARAAYTTAKGSADPEDGYADPITQYAISEEDVAGPFVEAIPNDMMDKSKLPALAYSSVLEMLAERFHASPKLLQKLNPGSRFAGGDVILVPNVEPFMPPGVVAARQPSDAVASAAAATPGADDAARAGGVTPQPREAKTVARAADLTVIVTDRTKTLEVKDASGAIVFHAPVTVGSKNDPLPLGQWKVNGVSRNPSFNYNPKLFWDADPSHAKAKIPAGPNNPVGAVWIDISKDHYGIHGTPEPSRVGYTESHGCIRLTNWDAMRLAAMVSPGTKVILQ